MEVLSHNWRDLSLIHRLSVVYRILFLPAQLLTCLHCKLKWKDKKAWILFTYLWCYCSFIYLYYRGRIHETHPLDNFSHILCNRPHTSTGPTWRKPTNKKQFYSIQHQSLTLACEIDAIVYKSKNQHNNKHSRNKDKAIFFIFL